MQTAKSNRNDSTGGTSNTALLRQALDLCVWKARGAICRLADEEGKTTGSFAVGGNYFSRQEHFFDIGNWTTSFFTGMALLAWRETKDDYFLKQVLRMEPLYREKVGARGTDTMHDLGFLYSLYSVALFKLTGDRNQREMGLHAADLLAGRFISNGNYIQAWGRMDQTDEKYAGLAIIDCLMNLPLLYWAWTETGNLLYCDIASSHAETTWKYFLRKDDSVCHAYRFDIKTGAPLHADNFCGHGVESHWARGTAWAIYGFALSHRYTKDGRFLDAAQRLALKFISNLDDNWIPVWDFRLPAGEKRLHDSSAAAVAVCGFQELAVQGMVDSRIVQAKDRLIQRMCENDYLNADPQCPGILRGGQVGEEGGKAKNAYTSWGDYFLMEALVRELHNGKTFW